MRSPGKAIAWELVAGNRWGLGALTTYVILLATMRAFVPGAGARIHIDSAETFAAVVVVPMTASFVYLLGVFTFGFAGDLAGRESIYPARMFSLPVSSTALAGWPMLIGAMGMVALWTATRTLAIWPADFVVPVVWPGFLAVAFLSTTQALTWMPYGLRGLRVVMALLCLTAMDAAVLLALYFKASESVMAVMIAPVVPLAFLVARHGVARARRGDTPDWSFAAWGIGFVPAAPRPFVSSSEAQAWLEWRRSGRSLPLLVATVVPCELALLFLLNGSTTLVLLILAAALATPPYLAAFAATTVRKSAPEATDGYGLTAFIAARPLTTASLLGAKLGTTVRSTVASWLIVAALVPTFVAVSGTAPILMDRWRSLSGGIGAPRSAVLIALMVGLAVLTTWKQLVQGLYIGLMGRESIVKTAIFVQLVLVFVLLFALSRAYEDGTVLAAAWDWSRWVLGALVAVKVTAAIVIAWRLDRSRLMSDRALVGGAALWCAGVLALYGVLAWFLSTPPLFPRYVLMIVAILVMPIARLSAAPLALAWNRHR